LKNLVDYLRRIFGRSVSENNVENQNLSAYLIGDHISKTTNRK